MTCDLPDYFQVSLRGGQLEGCGPDRISCIDIEILWDHIVSIIGPRRKGGNMTFISLPGATQSQQIPKIITYQD